MAKQTFPPKRATVLRRKRQKVADTVALYLPLVVIQAMEQRANLDYGGNKSAYATEALCRDLGISFEEVSVLGSTKAALAL